ncbi:hypothetical protein [Spirosoma sp. KNUC1025]|uniref:hypothetical protein n=1 Tax=Spirosoma sp. KNUC1025 TaxID=2894082 RepID=UPI00386834F9|nr:hypothetical protein LN737_25515 [Spirosoma sp. KNUC1025]
MPQQPYFLQAGPVEARYENGFLRYLTVGDAEILRMIYFAIRDHNWLTATLTITDEVVTQNARSFHIQYNWHIDDLGIRMAGQVTFQGDEAGTISVDFYGKTLNSFQKNRIGLCILHPVEGVLGQPAAIIDPAGNVTKAHFPTFISPHQPFLNIQTLRWQPASGLIWQLDFSGDVFETEDQRNWTDASFKTYSTPLTQPKPVTVSVGDEFQQQVVFSVAKQPISISVDANVVGEMEREIATMQPTHPRIGVGQWAGGPPLTESEIRLLRQLDLSHLRADVFFSLPNWQTYLSNAIADAQSLAIPLELAVFFGDDPATELKTLQGVLQSQSVTIRSMLLFNAATLKTSDNLLQALVPMIRNDWTNLAIGGGTDDNFAELNRNPFDFELVDFVTYSINPQVHAFDDLTLRENIAGQADTVVTARHISGGKPVHISPVTLRPRFTTVAGTATERLETAADHRQRTDFGAEWTYQSLAALAKAGVEAITYYQSHGPAGLVSGSTAYPVYDVLKNYKG